MDNDPRLLVLHPDDNVVVICQPIKTGERYMLQGKQYVMPATIGLGHKIARRAIGAGERVLKYGVPIGIATRPIAPGDHLHLHNMKSGYTATHSLEQAKAKYEAQT